MNLLDKRVYPKDCSVLMTLPVTREDFFSDLQNGRKDFLRSQNFDSAYSNQEKWDGFKKRAADDVLKMIDCLREQGVNVILRATLKDLVAVQRKSKVIVLFAHWRSGLALREEDIRWEKIGDVSMLPALSPVRRLLEASSTAALRKKITRRLNEILPTEALCSHPWFGQGPNQRPATEEHRVYLNRKFLDKQFPGVFGPNTSVEFADGLAPIEMVAGSFARTFQGIVDLSVCNSILLGELIRTQSPKCLIVATRLPADAPFRAIFYRFLFKGLRGGRPYIPVVDELRSSIKEFWRNKNKPQQRA